MDKKNKTKIARISRALLKILIPIFVVLVIYVITQLIVAFGINIYPVLKHWDSAQASQWLNNSVIAQFWVTVFVEALTLICLRFYLKKTKSSFKKIN